MPKTQARTPADGFTRKHKPQPTPKAEVKSEPPQSKRQENIEALIRLKAERLAPKQNPKKAGTAENPSPPQKRKRKSRATKEKQIQWLKINGIKLQDYTRADQYLAKQKREQTPMVFISYGQNYLCKVAGLWKYNLNLLIDDQLQSLSKVQLCGYYKQRDAEPVSAVMRVDDEIAAQKLAALVPRQERYRVDDTLLEESRLTETPIEMTLRTGHVFVGDVAWFTAYEIGLMLSTGVKVHVFRHAIYAVKADGQLQGEG